MSAEDNHDIKIRQRSSDKTFDINIVDGDFELEDSFDTNIFLSLFVDDRADESEVSQPERRRGFWGDLILFPNDPVLSSGSKLWLVSGRRTQDQLNKSIDFVRKGLFWLVFKNYAQQVAVEGNFIVNGIALNVTIIVDDNEVTKFTIKLWTNGQLEATESLQ